MANQAYTEARKNGNRKWDNANLDRISIAIPKGRKAVIQAAASAAGQSVNGYIVAAVNERIVREAMPSTDVQEVNP